MLIIKSLLILCSAAVVLANKAVVSGAIFVGEDTTDPSAAPVDIFREAYNHASATSSLLVYSAVGADFHPSTQPSKTLESSLDAFLQKASTFPGFFLERSESVSVPLNGSLFQFEEVIRESNPDYVNIALVARNLRDLVPGYIVNRDVKEWILSLIVIDKPKGEDTVKFGIVRVTLSIDTDKKHTAIIPKQSARLSTSVLKVNSGYLQSFADKLGNAIPITRVRDALDFFASPKVEDLIGDLTFSAAPCNKKPAVFANQAQRALYNWQAF